MNQPGTWRRWKLISVAVLAVLVIIIVLQNTQSVETRILFVSVSMPRAVLLFVTLLAGFVIGVITTGKWRVQRDKKATP